MSFWSDIGSFVTGGLLGETIISNPVVQQLAPIALSTVGVPPQVTSMGLNLLGYGPQQQPVQQYQQPVQQYQQPVQQYPYTVSQVPNMPNYQNPAYQTPIYQNQPPMTTQGINPYLQHEQFLPVKTTGQKMLDNVKTYWYFYVGGLVTVIGGIWYFKRNSYPKYRRR